MENTYGITRFALAEVAREIYCPIGEALYVATVSLEVVNPKEIPDYCDFTRHLKALHGASMTIEQLVNDVYEWTRKQVRSGLICVEVDADSENNEHPKAQVVKKGLVDEK